jgi:hypothetical protein
MTWSRACWSIPRIDFIVVVARNVSATGSELAGAALMTCLLRGWFREPLRKRCRPRFAAVAAKTKKPGAGIPGPGFSAADVVSADLESGIA